MVYRIANAERIRCSRCCAIGTLTLQGAQVPADTVPMAAYHAACADVDDWLFTRARES